MDVQMFATLLTGFSVLTALVVQAIKKIFENNNKDCPTNLVVVIVACIIGIGGTAVYYILNQMVFDGINITYMILMGFATGLASMVGYDKVLQAIEQFKRRS